MTSRKILLAVFSAALLALPAQAQQISGAGGGSSVTLPIDLASQVTGVLPSLNGGAGTVNGILQANGSGATSAVTVGSGLNYSGGTLSATGSGGNANFGTATGNVVGHIVTMANTTVGIQDSGVAYNAIPSANLISSLNAQTGTSYSVSSSTDGGKIVSASNASAVAFTLPAAGTLGSGYGVDLNDIGAGALTTTLASGNFDNGQTSIVTVKGQELFAWSDGTNVHSWLSLPVMASDTLLANFTASSNYPVAATMPACASDGSHALTFASHALACTAITAGSGTVNSGTAGNGAYYATSTTAVSDGSAAVVNFGAVQVGTGSAPTNGIALKTTNDPCIFSNSTCRLDVGTTLITTTLSFISSNAGGFDLITGATSGTAPNILPNRGASTTGIGAQASGNMSFIASATEIERITSTGPLLLTVPTDATHTDATICRDTTSGALLTGTGTLGVCLGTSTMRAKENIHEITDADALLKLRPVSFNYRKGWGYPADKQYYGFIAEDVKKVLPKLVGVNSKGQTLNADYLGMIPLMVRQMQKQEAEITSLRKQLASRK